MSTLSQSIRSAFESRGLKIKSRGQDNFTTQCPAHDDNDPSLDVDFKQGVALFCCRSAGCETEAIMSAVGLQWSDMWEEGSLAEQTLRTSEPLITYRYVKPDGTPYMEVGRFADKHGKKEFKPRPVGQRHWGLPDNFMWPLYRLDRVVPAAQRGDTIYIVEGEKDVHALERLGVVATTKPGGAGSPWRDDYTRWLEGAGRIVIVADNDTTGRQYAPKWAMVLEGHGHTVDVVISPDHKDSYDHVAAGLGLDDFVPMEEDGLPLMSLRQLVDTDYPEPEFLLPGLLPPGLAMLAGSSKVGKSALALDVALAVAHDGRAWNGVDVETGGAVLYLALDNDNERRFKGRAVRMMQQDLDPNVPLDLATTWGQGVEAQDQIRAWTRRRRRKGDKPILVVVDLGTNVEPRLLGASKRGESDYKVVSDALREWHDLAMELGLCILLLHHDRKPSGQGSNDFVDDFIGSRAVTGGIATLWMLRRQRNSPEATLHVTGRDIGESELEFRFSEGRYLVFDIPGDLVRLGSNMQRVISYVRSRGEHVARNELIAAFPEINPKTLDNYLSKAVKTKRIVRVESGVYVG